MRNKCSCVAAALALIVGRAAVAQKTRPVAAVEVDANGVGHALVDWPREQPVEFGVWVVRDNWKRVAQQWSLTGLPPANAADPQIIRGRFDGDGAGVSIEQRTGPDSLHYTLTSPGKIDDLTGIFWFFNVPTDAFAGGRLRLGDQTIELPVQPPKDVHLGQGSTDHAVLTSRDGTRQIDVRFAAPRWIQVQDARGYGAPMVELYTAMHDGPAAAGTAMRLDVTLAAHVRPGPREAGVVIHRDTRLAPFDGFGANFVYAIDDPATEASLREMKPAWARIGLDGREWASGPDEAAAVAAADTPGSPLRKRFELARRLAGLTDGRLILTMWYPPERLFNEPTTDRQHGGKIPRDRWPALADGVVAYLTRLKTAYGVEPRLFSFNESDLGIYLLLDGDDTRDLFRLLGRRFAAAGLSTKLLLGDSADLEKGLTQIAPTLADDAARGFVGALAYHPWSGQNALWPRWAELAKQYDLPLLTTEMGSDASGWRTGAFNDPLPTLRLGRRYVEQLRDARSTALLEWEWTGDYSPFDKAPDGTLRLSPRGLMLRQLNRLTPTPGQTIQVDCDNPTLDVAAVCGSGSAIAVHLINRDGPRDVRLSGLPETGAAMVLHVIDPRSGEQPATQVPTAAGRCAFTLPAGAIATLVAQ